jgi:histidinol-phosphatase (PHP family)
MPKLMQRGSFMQLKSIIDCHTHSSFSIDSEMPAVDGGQSAINAGLGGLIFTDHLDIDYPNPAYDFSFDFAARSKFLDKLRQDFAGKVKILKGLELGFQPQIVQAASKVVKSYDFDFVLCSVHVVDKIDLCHKSFQSGRTKEQAYRRYLQAIYESVDKFDDFDVVGHIGYLCRYVSYQDKSLNYVDYSDILDMIFKRVIEKGKGIEVNTAGYFYKLGFTHPGFDSIKRYRELGGQIITIGSDAHDAGRVGADFSRVLTQLADIGFKYVTYFENRKPVFVKI